jgi:hypothetical protein
MGRQVGFPWEHSGSQDVNDVNYVSPKSKGLHHAVSPLFSLSAGSRGLLLQE